MGSLTARLLGRVVQPVIDGSEGLGEAVDEEGEVWVALFLIHGCWEDSRYVVGWDRDVESVFVYCVGWFVPCDVVVSVNSEVGVIVLFVVQFKEGCGDEVGVVWHLGEMGGDSTYSSLSTCCRGSQ